MNMYSILGKPLGRGVITHYTPLITLIIGNLHREEISLLVLEGSTADVILGCPWLQIYSPVMSWSSGEITKCSYVPNVMELVLF